jgi:hypothetical protein
MRPQQHSLAGALKVGDETSRCRTAVPAITIVMAASPWLAAPTSNACHSSSPRLPQATETSLQSACLCFFATPPWRGAAAQAFRALRFWPPLVLPSALRSRHLAPPAASACRSWSRMREVEVRATLRIELVSNSAPRRTARALRRSALLGVDCFQRLKRANIVMDTGWDKVSVAKAKCLIFLARPTGIEPVFQP